MNTMAQARIPAPWAARNSAVNADSSTAATMPPAAAMRSRTSITRSYRASGSTIWRSKSRGRACVPIRSASRKPRVVTSTTRSPRRSSRALVATVVPILTEPTSVGEIGSPTCSCSNRRMPSTAASEY
jgi:hypothetical protein